MTNIDFHFVVPLWGEKYTEEFIKVTLPNQLSPGNLGAFRDRSQGDKYILYTRRADAAVIQQSRAFAQLKKIIPTEFHYIDDLMEDVRTRKINKYDVMTICHGRGLENAKHANAAIVPIPCDIIFSDGSFANMLKLTLAGKRLIVIGSCRISSETFIPAIIEKFYDKTSGTIPIKSRDLVRLVLSHIHPASKALFVDAKAFLNPSPAYLYWMVKGEGILERGIHLQPMMINPANKNARLAAEAGMGIDGYDFMQRAVPDLKDVHVVEDTDEIAYFSFCETEPGEYQSTPINIPYVSWWIRNYCCDFHLDFLDRKIRMHAGKITSKWAEVEQESDKLIACLHNCLDCFDKAPEIYNGVDLMVKGLQEREQLKDRLRRVSEDDAILHNNIGIEHYKKGDKKEAKRLLEKAIGLTPYYLDPYTNLAVIYKEQGDIPKAVNFMKGALALQPKNIQLWLMLGEISLSGGLKNQTRNCLKKALSLETKDTAVLTSIAELALEIDDIESIQKVYEKLKRMAPANIMTIRLEQALSSTLKSEMKATVI